LVSELAQQALVRCTRVGGSPQNLVALAHAHERLRREGAIASRDNFLVLLDGGFQIPVDDLGIHRRLEQARGVLCLDAGERQQNYCQPDRE